MTNVLSVAAMSAGSSSSLLDLPCLLLLCKFDRKIRIVACPVPAVSYAMNQDPEGNMASVDAQTAWNAVLKHDRRFDGHFVYAVSSTRICCRPSCPSRRPARHRVSFFPSPQPAEATGFRLQRAFRRSLGLSPKAYQDAKRIERFTALLQRGESVTTATYAAGFGSSSRVAECVSRALGMTPSAYRSGGKGVTLRYATARTPVGRALIAGTERGVVSVSLGNSDAELLILLKEAYPHAELSHDPKGLKRQIHALLQCLNGTPLSDSISLAVQGTAFQRKVWRTLQEIPPGSTRTYREIAREIGQPTAARAVAWACATNPVAIVIPCHRVVREGGHLAGYRWGLERKKALLALEQERQES